MNAFFHFLSHSGFQSLIPYGDPTERPISNNNKHTIHIRAQHEIRTYNNLLIIMQAVWRQMKILYVWTWTWFGLVWFSRK